MQFIPNSVNDRAIFLIGNKDCYITLEGSNYYWTLEIGHQGTDKIFFAEGWSEFAADNLLVKGDDLVISYRNGLFTVTVLTCSVNTVKREEADVDSLPHALPGPPKPEVRADQILAEALCPATKITVTKFFRNVEFAVS